MPSPLPLSTNPGTSPSGEEPTFATTRLKFYLLGSGKAFPSTAYFNHMIRLDAPVRWNGQTYYLVAAMNNDDQDLALRLVEPAPTGWFGSVEQAKQALRQSGLIHLWWAIDAFARKFPQDSLEVASKFIGLIPWCDGAAWPSEWGYHPILWDGSYEDWFEFIDFDQVMELCPRVMINRLFGSDAVVGYNVGFHPDGTPIGCEPLAPRILAAKPSLPSHIMNGFVDSLGPRCTDKRGKGGEVIGYIGAPSLDFAGTGLEWVSEMRSSGINSAFDILSAIDRTAAQQCVRVTDELLALGDRIYGEPHEGLYPEELGGWYDGRFRIISLPARAELVHANPNAYMPLPNSENILWAVTGTVQERVDQCKLWIDRGWSATSYVRIDTGQPLGTGHNMSEAQIAELIEYGL